MKPRVRSVDAALVLEPLKFRGALSHDARVVERCCRLQLRFGCLVRSFAAFRIPNFAVVFTKFEARLPHKRTLNHEHTIDISVMCLIGAHHACTIDKKWLMYFAPTLIGAHHAFPIKVTQSSGQLQAYEAHQVWRRNPSKRAALGSSNVVQVHRTRTCCLRISAIHL